jgi:hypothetical protein
MGRHTVLVIHNDPRVVRRLKETFASLGDTYVWARSQEEARRLLDGGIYSDILLDLEIPASSRGGIPSGVFRDFSRGCRIPGQRGVAESGNPSGRGRVLRGVMDPNECTSCRGTAAFGGLGAAQALFNMGTWPVC